MRINYFKQGVYSEFLKIISNKSTKIVLPIIFILQPFLAYVSTKQILNVGLNATPETDSSLLEAVPPIEYIGFDSILLGLFAMIILGAIIGGGEFKKKSLRTSLLLNPNKLCLFSSKFFATILFIFIISITSIYISIILSQFALGDNGINPFLLNAKVWLFILLGSISWTLLTMLSFVIAFLFKNSVASLLFLIPQLYNLGDFLAGRVMIAKVLPVVLGQDLIATSPSRLSSSFCDSALLLGLWVLIFTILAIYKFLKSDTGSE